MEAGEENGGNSHLKRQRAPLSDSEDNVLSPSEVNDGQKRRRLEASGQENRSPKPSSSGRIAELETKPDTPMVPSVRSRVQELTQRRGGAALPAQRCLSDPGAHSLSVNIQERGFREHLLSEGEFNQRMERFKVPVFQASPAPTESPADPCPRTCSNFVSGIQQKLQDTTTPSSEQASRMRDQRNQELSRLRPISENAWLKRSSSDPSLTQQADGDAEMKDGSFTEALTSGTERHSSDSTVELSSHDETNTAEVIDQMFEEVLEYAGRMQGEGVEDEDTEDHDSGIGVCPGDKDKMDMESEKEKSEEEHESNGDELLTFPPSGILSPLSKSVEAVVTPLRLAVSQESNPPSLLLTPGETSTPPAESAPLYSIDAYRTQRQIKPSTIQSVTPGVQRRAPVKSQPQPSVNTKEKITALNEEAGKLQTIINQTLQALSCCTDEEHGRGSLEEAEAEKLLLVSCEKRSALLAEVARLREERNSESGEAAGEDEDIVSQQPCRGTVTITNIQLPLKVEFVCSSHNRSGRPSHYFFILIRYGPCNIVATPLATAADAQNGDTISFPTSVTLKDIRSSFEIDVEVYSLSHTSGSNCSTDRTTTKSRVTPRKLLNTITRSSNSLTSAPPAVNTRRSSNFCLVGSHKITLASLGHSKFPLDKMKLEGKIRRLLGDEFQEKVPFLSPLEGNIYLRLNSESHSNVQHQGFLTMFELISGYGVWHRRYFVLEECNMYYWNHPNDKETKEAEGSISLSNSLSQSVRPVKRDSCARPFTFELVSSITQQQKDDSQEALSKCWFAADTKQERLDWMEKLNQVLLDFHTWNRTSKSEQLDTSSSGNLRESIL
ncbi:anillin, actin binding protein 2 isoform X10 [Sparus aurata]|uniref:anillin, actin binding protein 2 isoform X10 n=1 Tax=Sparus aurata TaxID=8175 RepID=UPI0011C15DF4|nr:anillin-like isoform X10 [Sparus aurata]